MLVVRLTANVVAAVVVDVVDVVCLMCVSFNVHSLACRVVRHSGFAKDMGKMAGELKDVPKEFQVSHSACCRSGVHSIWIAPQRGGTTERLCITIIILPYCTSKYYVVWIFND